MAGYAVRSADRWGACPDCGKQSYGSKRVAKSVARQHLPGERRLSPYRCPYGWGWHFGHLAEPVVRGEIDRQALYGRGA
jgi:hypothetical protein